MINLETVKAELNNFAAFVRYKNFEVNGSYSDIISFTDEKGFLYNEEGYKTKAAIEAQGKLNKDKWFGSSEIYKFVVAAMSRAKNLVDSHQITDFRDRCNPDHSKYRSEATAVLYDIYCGKDDAAAFKRAVDTFGAKYDVIAFLFYIKNPNKYLPIHSSNFDKSFDLLDIKFVTSHKCSWENYQKFLSIMEEIRKTMDETLIMEETPRLIDAHSFAWIVHEETYRKWKKKSSDEKLTIRIVSDMELASERSNQWYIDGIELDDIEKATGKKKRYAQGTGGKSNYATSSYKRSQEVVRIARERANGVCQLCGNPAPFNDKKGNPYLEVHHVVWLLHGGIDCTDNAVALCPNCHTKMHIVDDPMDVEKLKAIAAGGEVPNAKTREAIQEVQRMKGNPELGKAYSDADQMMEELFADDAE